MFYIEATTDYNDLDIDFPPHYIIITPAIAITITIFIYKILS